jgi:hypothetical protein
MEALNVDLDLLRGGKDLATRLAEVLNAWEKMRPEKSFYSMTLQEFKEAVKPFTDALKEIADLESRVAHAVSKRDAAAPNVRDLLQGVVNAVKGDRSEGGEKGELYSAMGYIPISQRASGLVRPRKEGPPTGGSSTQ